MARAAVVARYIAINRDMRATLATPSVLLLNRWDNESAGEDDGGWVGDESDTQCCALATRAQWERCANCRSDGFVPRNISQWLDAMRSTGGLELNVVCGKVIVIL